MTMDEMIKKTAEKVLSSLSCWGWADQAYMLYEIADRLKEYADECLQLEYGITSETE